MWTVNLISGALGNLNPEPTEGVEGKFNNS